MDEQVTGQERTTGSEGGNQKRPNYEAEAYQFSRHQWNWNFPVNVGVLILTIFVAAGVWAQYKALDQTLKETRDDFKASERPYVSIGRKDGQMGRFVEPKDMNKSAGIKLYFHNGGHLPALNFNVAVSNPEGTRPLVHMGRLVDRVNNETLQIAGSNIISGDSEYIAIFDDWISEADVALAKDGKKNIAVNGLLEYCDEFGAYDCRFFHGTYKAELNEFYLVLGTDCGYAYPSTNIKWPQPLEYLPPCGQPDQQSEEQQRGQLGMIENMPTPIPASTP
jgi:hypothetical protein